MTLFTVQPALQRRGRRFSVSILEVTHWSSYAPLTEALRRLGSKRRSKRELETTLTLESAIAALIP